MGKGGYTGGHTIIVGGQFAPEGPAITKSRPSKPFSNDFEKPAREERKSPPPQVVRKGTPIKPPRPAKPEVAQLDKFGLPIGLAAEGVPGPNERSHYLDVAPDRPFFNRVKALILDAARRGSVVLSDFLIVLTDSKIRTLRGAAWKREYVSGLIYDIRYEKYLPRPPSVVKETAPPASVKPIIRRVERMQKPSSAPLRQPVPKDFSDKAAAELQLLEQRIVELEQAWDDALSLGQRKKIRDQLEATRKKRKKWYESFG